MVAADYIRLFITVVFLGLFSFQVLTNQSIHNLVTEYLVVLVGFWFGLDRLSDFLAKYAAEKNKSNGVPK